MIKGKAWGSTEDVIVTPLCEVHRIHVAPGGFCSWHRHERKWNAFAVLDGRLTIETREGELLTRVVLGPGDVSTVAPGVEHRFAQEPEQWRGTVRALEIYYPDSLSEDIVRSSVGGIA